MPYILGKPVLNKIFFQKRSRQQKQYKTIKKKPKNLKLSLAMF